MAERYICSIKGCKREPELKLEGKYLCGKHWDKHCRGSEDGGD